MSLATHTLGAVWGDGPAFKEDDMTLEERINEFNEVCDRVISTVDNINCNLRQNIRDAERLLNEVSPPACGNCQNYLEAYNRCSESGMTVDIGAICENWGRLIL